MSAEAGIEFVVWHDMASAPIQRRDNLLPYLEI
jgi:hypothetical protein